MKSYAPRLALVMLAALLSQAPAMAAKGSAAKEPVAATVNGVAVPESRVEALVAQQTAKGAPDSPQLREQIKNFLVGRELLAQQAKSKGLEKSPEVMAELEMARQQILIGAYLQQFLKAHPISDAAIKAEYDRLVAANPQKEYKARHILVEKESEAKDIIAKLDKGEKFDTLATQSKDPGSKDKGGDLGWNVPGNFVKEFSDAMVALNKGSYTTAPVKSQFGYHVIKLEDSRDAKAPPLDEVKGQIQQALVGRSVEQHVAELRQKAKVQ
ncbi:MAG: peptidylprolyl isomerase [Rhodocyclaceae bacterium]|nr:peptidylprolyl isomerase [Rhodocyclaceae bacterium]